MTHATSHDVVPAKSNETVAFRALAFGVLLPAKALVLLASCLAFILVAAIAGLVGEGD